MPRYELPLWFRAFVGHLLWPSVVSDRELNRRLPKEEPIRRWVGNGMACFTDDTLQREGERLLADSGSPEVFHAIRDALLLYERARHVRSEASWKRTLLKPVISHLLVSRYSRGFAVRDD